jgi:hypothetical protein
MRLTLLVETGLAYTLPRSGGVNVKFVEELDRNYLEYKPMTRQFADASQVK